jgi:hypothetical protein
MERKLFGQFDEAQVAQLEQMLATVRQNATDLISQAEASTTVARPKRERRPIPHSG